MAVKIYGSNQIDFDANNIIQNTQLNNTVLNDSLTALDTTASNGATSNADNTALPLFGCRAFVSWSGRITSSIGGETCCKIDSSGNVSKVVKTATGTYQIYFTIPMPDANYTVMQCLQDGSNNIGPGGQIGLYGTQWQDLRPANKLAGSLLLHYRYQGNNTAYDVHDCNVVIFR